MKAPSLHALPRREDQPWQATHVRRPRVAELMVEQLARWGVRFVFGLPGADNLAFLDAVEQHPQLQFYGVRHAEAAALMASAVAKLTGQIAVCTATAGPGIAGLINGLGDAQADGAPVVALTGQVESRHLGTPSNQYVDQQALLGPVTQRSSLLTHPDAAADLLANAMRTALAQGTTTHLSVPRDLWSRPTSSEVVNPEPYLFTPRRSAHHIVAEAARLLAEAERPVVVAGLGCARAVPQLLKLAERLHAPVIHTLPIAGKIPWQHPLTVGSLGEGGSEAAGRLLEEADCVFRVGANWWPEAFVPEIRRPRIIALDIRPEHLGKGAGADFGVVGDCGEILHEMEGLINGKDREAWAKRIGHLRGDWIDQLHRESGLSRAERFNVESTIGAIHPARIVSELSAVLPHDALICLDVGDHVVWFNRHFRGSGQDIVLSGSWRTVGFSLPAALAARLVHPHRPVVAITGDGGFTMSLAELGTAMQHQLPVAIILFRNGMYATEAHQAQLEGFSKVGTRLENPDFGQLVASWGGAAHRVGRPEQIASHCQAALQASVLTLVDIPTQAVMPPAARRLAVAGPNGRRSFTEAESG